MPFVELQNGTLVNPAHITHVILSKEAGTYMVFVVGREQGLGGASPNGKRIIEKLLGGLPN